MGVEKANRDNVLYSIINQKVAICFTLELINERLHRELERRWYMCEADRRTGGGRMGVVEAEDKRVLSCFLIYIK